MHPFFKHSIFVCFISIMMALGPMGVEAQTQKLAQAPSVNNQLNGTSALRFVDESELKSPRSTRAIAKNLQNVTALPVVVDERTWSTMAVGDVTEVALPNGKNYSIKIESSRRESGANGLLTVTGYAMIRGAETDKDYRVVLVLTPNNPAATQGWIVTPDGDFAIVPQVAQSNVDTEKSSAKHSWFVEASDVQLALPIAIGSDGVAQSDAVIHPSTLALAANKDRLQAKADPVCPAITTKPTQQTTIDLMLVYTDDWVAAHGSANINSRLAFLVAEANRAMDTSNVAITYRLVHSVRVTLSTSVTEGVALDQITGGAAPFQNIAATRNQFGADMVGLLRGPKPGGGIAGIAWVGGGDQTDIARAGNIMYSVSGDAPGFGGLLFAHELGHNLGNNHDLGNGGGFGGVTSYSNGHVVCGSGASTSCPTGSGFYSTGTGFGTIMSYPQPQVGKFSSPNLTCQSTRSGAISAPCGINAGAANAADNVRSMNCIRDKVAAFRAAVTPVCVFPSTDSDNDGIPNCVEPTVSLNANVKDNNVFGVSQLFAMQQYRDFLNREGDASGVTFWTGELDASRQTRSAMVETFATSGEFDTFTAPISRLYFGTYLRIPDYPGLQFWTDEYRSGRRTLLSIGQSFASAQEFVNRYGNVDNRTFVNLIYSNVLGRAADQAGGDFFTNELNSGRLTRGGMLTQFTEGNEYKQTRRGEIFTTNLFAGLLRRAPNATEFSSMVSAIRGGATVASQAGILLNANEYRLRFLP